MGYLCSVTPGPQVWTEDVPLRALWKEFQACEAVAAPRLPSMVQLDQRLGSDVFVAVQGVQLVMGVPQSMDGFMENPIYKWMMTGVCSFQETSMCISIARIVDDSSLSLIFD